MPNPRNIEINSNEIFSPENLKTDFMIQEWGQLMKKVGEMPAEASVETIRTWGKIIRTGLDVEVWKN
jgi:hypothetical protein